jgi:NAD(P)H-hydrate epimerase
MREIDRLTTERHGIPSLVLMENAAAACARVIAATLSGDLQDKSILVLCGRGNNGGDGAATARLLAAAGARVRAILFGKREETQGDARTNFDALAGLAGAASRSNARVEFHECVIDGGCSDVLDKSFAERYDVIVDALFGTGLTRPLVGIHKEVVDRLKRLKVGNSTCAVVSIDIPSGLNSDSAELIGPAIQADITVTMTAPKIANALAPAADCAGKLITAEIGSPPELTRAADTKLFLTEEADARQWLIATRYKPGSYKNIHGHAVIVAGSRGFTGAAALCANAAMRAGAGLVTVATPASAQPLVATQVMPEVMTTALAETDRGTVSDEAFEYFSKFSERADVIAIGPGLSSEDERTRSFVRAAVEKRRTPVVIDADGLNCLSPWPSDLRGSREAPIVLTPHPGEMLRLLGMDNKAGLNDRVGAAREFAANHQVILVLKTGRSLIATPDGRVFVNSTGNAGLGTAGAGDTLTGIITSFLAQVYGGSLFGTDALSTTTAALYIGGLASDLAARELGMRCMVASDIREHLSAAICSLDPRGEQPQAFS